jgi:sorting and assembly machinery component 37
MSIELHVYGPGFSLPSIDPQCLSAIAYLSQAVPRGEWSLIASGDPAVSPTKELPALRHGSAWIGGFTRIVEYLRSYNAEWDLDMDLDARQKADSVAYVAGIC